MATCSIVECGRETVARGWCQRHYYTWKRTGDVLGLKVQCTRCGDERYHNGGGGPHRLCPLCRENFAICGICKEILPGDLFHRNRQGKPHGRCKPCNAVYTKHHPSKKPYKKTPEQARRSNLKRLYGISPEDYDEMFERQGGCCRICGQSSDKLVVDHCHRRGSVRSLLCGGCNSGLGMFQDNPEILARAIECLTDHGQETS